MIETYNSVDNMVADTNPAVLIGGITIQKNQGILVRGTVLGEVTATKVMVKTDKASVDGSEVASVILHETVDTDQASDVKAVAYKAGCFFSSALVFGGASVLADHQVQLRDVNIYTK